MNMSTETIKSMKGKLADGICYSINHKRACNHFQVFTITSNQDLPLIPKKPFME